MTKTKLLAGSIFALVACAAAARTLPMLRGADAYGDWRADSPGLMRLITPADLPAPYASRSAATGVSVVPAPAGASLKLPPGFSAEPALKGLEGPRVVRAAPNGDIFLTESEGGRVRALRFEPGKAAPVQNEVFAGGLDRPFGVAFYPPGPNPTHVYVATQNQLLRYPYKSGELKPAGPAEKLARLPAAGAGHWTRDVAVSSDGATIYVSIGSKSNVAEGQHPFSRAETEALEKAQGIGASVEPGRALVAAFDPDGGNRRVFATGLRNCVGLAIQPGSGDPWCVVNERDMLGDNLPPDYATHVTQGAFYGWPWYYIGANQDPRHKNERPDLKDRITTPDVLIQPHSAPLGIVFYEGGQFPADYKGDAFVALHGSWNRAKRTGYKIVRLRFEAGKPTGEYQDFVTGFVLDDDKVSGASRGGGRRRRRLAAVHRGRERDAVAGEL